MQEPGKSGERVRTQRNAAWSGSWATLRDLEVFQAVIEERKTTAAALRLGISQPAVSRALASMEQKSKRSLFRHQGTRLVPTADAMALYEKVQPIFHALAQLSHFDWTQQKPASLRIARPPTMAHCFLESLTAGFMRDNKDTLVSLDIVTTPDVLGLVADGRADIGVADVQAPNSGLQRAPFRWSQVVCVLPDSHPLCAKETIGPADLNGEPMVMLARRNPIRPALERAFGKAASRPRVVFETTTAQSALRFVAEGAGCALVNPFPVLLAQPPGVAVRAFAPPMGYEASFFTSAAEMPSAAMKRYMEYVRSNQPAAMFKSEPIR